MMLITRPCRVTWGGHVGAGLGFPVCCRLKMWHLRCVGCSIRRPCRPCYCMEVRHGVCLQQAWNVWRVSTFVLHGECQAKVQYGRRMGPGCTHARRMCFMQLVWNQSLTMWICGNRPSQTLSSIGQSMSSAREQWGRGVHRFDRFGGTSQWAWIWRGRGAFSPSLIRARAL